MPLRAASSRRRAAAVVVTAVAVLILTGGAVWHVRDLHGAAVTRLDRLLMNATHMTGRLIEGWYAERQVDAVSLAELASLRHGESIAIAPDAAERILRLQMEATKRRGDYLGIWLVGANGRTLDSVGTLPLTAAESLTAMRAMTTHRAQISEAETTSDGVISVAIAAPVGTRASDGAMVVRTGLRRAFGDSTPFDPRSVATTLIVIPAGASIQVVTQCARPSRGVCLHADHDSLSRAALRLPDGFGFARDANGRTIVAATHPLHGLPWGVVIHVDTRDAFAGFWQRLRFEMLALGVIVGMLALAAYAYNRAARFRRLAEIAQTEERFAAIVNTALDAIIIANERFEIVVANDSAEAMFGYGGRQLIGRSLLDLVPDDVSEELRGALTSSLEIPGQPRLFFSDEYACGRRRDGTEFPIDVSLSRATIADQPHLTVVIRDVTDRSEAHQRLRASEARFKTLVESLDEVVITLDRDGKTTGAFGRGMERLGLSAEKLVGRPLYKLFDAESVSAPADAHRRALLGETVTFEFKNPKINDGAEFAVSVSPLRDADGEVTEIVSVTRDITPFKRAEESSEWQRRVLEEIATGVELREVLMTVARLYEMHCPGVQCAVHLIDDDGLTLRSVAAPTIRPEFIEAMDEIVVGPNASSIGSAVYRRDSVFTSDIDGDSVWNDYRALALEQGYHSCWALPLRSPQGRMLGAMALYSRERRLPTGNELRVAAMATQLAGIAIDRAHAAESLRQSEASFRSFVENSPIGIYRATGTGRLLAVNPSLVQLLGYNSALDLLQLDLARDVFAQTGDLQRLLRQLEAHGDVHGLEMEWRRKDGSLVSVRVSSRGYRDDRGAVWFTEGFVENVTPLRAAEQALRQSEKLAALGQLVSGVAHELNNPIAAILHFAEDLLDDSRTPGDIEAISVIRDQARRSRAIVRDLLSFVRFRHTARERVSLTDAISSTTKALEPSVKELGATLIVELPDPDVSGNTDRAGLQQIVTNLVMNGAQACREGGVVRLRALASAQELLLIVEDTGPGIPANIMDRIFEPFFTTKPLGEGTGLGLSVTLGIVQQLGGRIAATNRPPAEGGGARFTVTLPINGTAVVDPGPGKPTAVLTPRVSGSNEAVPEAQARALIIDDEPSIRAALRRFFMRRGWAVEEASDGAAGLAKLEETGSEYTVVISDLKMPGLSGVELHDHLAATRPHLLDRVIFSTGDVASKDAAEFVRRTRCLVLQKPFELRALDDIVSQLRQVPT